MLPGLEPTALLATKPNLKIHVRRRALRLHKAIPPLLPLLILFGLAWPVLAQDSGASATVTAGPADSEEEEDEKKLPLTTLITLGNTVGIGSFVPGDFTKRPLYELGITFSPKVTLTDQQKIGASFSVSKTVIGNADSQISRPGQTLLSDININYAYSKLVEEPVTGLGLNAKVEFFLPTSLLSQLRTQVLAIRPRLGISGDWDWINAGYTFRVTKYFHEFDHPSVEALDEIPICIDRASGDPDRCFPGGYANSSYQLANGLSLGFVPIDDLSIDFAYWTYNTFSYNAHPVEDEFTPANADVGRGQRDLTLFGAEVSYGVNDYLNVALGTETYQPPKTLDNQSFRFPFFSSTADNFTSFYLNLAASF